MTAKVKSKTFQRFACLFLVQYIYEYMWFYLSMCEFFIKIVRPSITNVDVETVTTLNRSSHVNFFQWCSTKNGLTKSDISSTCLRKYQYWQQTNINNNNNSNGRQKTVCWFHSKERTSRRISVFRSSTLFTQIVCPSE